MRRLLVGLAFLVCIPASAGVTGTVSIKLREARLDASLDYEYVAFADETSINLLLNPAFEVRKVTCPICRGFRIERSGSDPAALVIDLSKPLAKDEHLALKIEYGGSIADSYKRPEEFLELGLDDFWYPVHPRVGEFEFRHRLAVNVDEPGFELLSNGAVRPAGRNRWRVESRVPDLDIDLVLGRHLDTVRDRHDGYDLTVVTQGVPAKLPRQVLEEMQRTLDFYNSTFGAAAPERRVTGVFRPFVSREGQGGYFRKGYFVLTKLTDAGAALPAIEHELAHHWWIRASQQNAWLNESFAEYSAMMATRRLHGQAAFDRMLEDKRAKVASAPLPPIYGFDRTKNRRATPAVLYSKGPLVLNALEREIGEARFVELLRRMIAGNVTDTDRLVRLVGEVSGPRVQADFLQLLKE